MIRALMTAALLAATLARGAGAPAGPGDVGLERGLEVVLLPRSDYAVAPQDDATPLILRIESVKPVPGRGFEYTIRSQGFEVGEYKLADYLVRADGSSAVELGDRTLKVTGLLPQDHDGRLQAFVPTPLPWFGGYRPALIALVVLWVAALPVLVLAGRKRRVRLPSAPIVPEPGRLERMRPLVLAASEGRLDQAGRAELERLMLGHWRAEFGLPEGNMGEVMAAMRVHPAAGPLLFALERWLHDPRGASPGEIDTLLSPYRVDSGRAGKGAGA